jgi:hypothetical protein
VTVVLASCDRCVRGVVHREGGWGDKCAVCEGQGIITLTRLAELIDEWAATLSKFFQPRTVDMDQFGRPRMRISTMARITGKLADLSTKETRS